MHDAWLSANSINLLQHNLRISFSISADVAVDVDDAAHCDCDCDCDWDWALDWTRAWALDWGFAALKAQVKLKLECCDVSKAPSPTSPPPPSLLPLHVACPIFDFVYFI